ncbi:MAG: helix-turn-helix domain-containing protein, partial [Myxococcota bacterium]
MPYKKSERSAAEIVSAAIRVLARQGYARTSLLDIAKEAGMSKGAVHYHVPTKEALLHVVLETALGAVQRRTIEAWTGGESPFISLRRSLETLWSIRAERSDEALVVADLLALSLSNESLRPQLAEFYRLAASQI